MLSSSVISGGYTVNMTSRTAQIVYLMLAGTFCAIVLSVVGALIVAIFHFGDGEAAKIINDLTPVVLGVIGSIALVFTGHTVANLRAPAGNVVVASPPTSA